MQAADLIVVSTAFPTSTEHGWKYIAFGPDDKLYVPVGAPCNVCDLEKWTSNLTYGAIWRMNADGSSLEEFATGRQQPRPLGHPENHLFIYNLNIYLGYN